jgi:hypothetical protein
MNLSLGSRSTGRRAYQLRVCWLLSCLVVRDGKGTATLTFTRFRQSYSGSFFDEVSFATTACNARRRNNYTKCHSRMRLCGSNRMDFQSRTIRDDLPPRRTGGPPT